MSKELLTIKFEGKALSTRSLPIYELGSVFIAIQRIVHKASLHVAGRREKGVLIPTSRRQQIALQVSTHRKGSDLWGLAPYLTDPAVGPILQNLISAGIGALAVYAAGKIGKQKEPPANQGLVVNIFPEVKQLVDRIGNVGGVDRITIGQSGKGRDGRVVIDLQVQAAVRELEFQLVEGTRQRIRGVVAKLLPQSCRLDLRDSSDHYIRVRTAEKLFERVRRLPTLMEREIEFEGVPLYRLGDGSGAPDEFIAERLILPRRSRA